MKNEHTTLVNAIRKLIDYDAETGQLTWKPRGVEWFSNCKHPERAMKSWNAKHSGRLALNVTNRGYRQGWFLGRKVLKAHHAAWAFHHGKWPDRAIDHINRDKGDNRISNLRLVSIAQNNANRRYDTAAPHGVQQRKNGKWMARIKKNGKSRYLGQFDTVQQAAQAYQDAAEKIHQDYAPRNKSSDAAA